MIFFYYFEYKLSGDFMFTVYFSKRKLVKLGLCMLLILFGVFVGAYVILTCVDIAASNDELPIYRVRTDEKKIALTFDVAWGNSDTEQIINILNENNVKATFFITGEWVSKYPEDVKRYFESGHEIGNHSDSHPYPAKITINELINDATECKNKIEAIIGTAPTLYRAPYGDYNDTVVATVNGMGYKMIQWDCDSLDWKDISAEEINRRIINNVSNGSILLFHTDKENTHSALTDLIPYLQGEGYKFVTVSELIYHENFDIDANGEQFLLS